MSITSTCLKILKKATEVMRDDGFNDKDVKDTFDYAEKVVNKSVISENLKSVLLDILEKGKKDIK